MLRHRPFPPRHWLGPRNREVHTPSSPRPRRRLQRESRSFPRYLWLGRSLTFCRIHRRQPRNESRRHASEDRLDLKRRDSGNGERLAKGGCSRECELRLAPFRRRVVQTEDNRPRCPRRIFGPNCSATQPAAFSWPSLDVNVAGTYPPDFPHIRANSPGKFHVPLAGQRGVLGPHPFDFRKKAGGRYRDRTCGPSRVKGVLYR